MALHGCNHTFEQLASEVFPALFSVLNRSLQSPLALCVAKDAPPVHIPALPGCYVIAQQGTPIYVGIAKNMRRRIQDHLSDNPSRANLAVCMAAKQLGVGLSKIKRHPHFQSAFEPAGQHLLNCGVAWVGIPNPLEMYIFKPYCAMRLDTSEYNFFDALQILTPKARSPH